MADRIAGRGLEGERKPGQKVAVRPAKPRAMAFRGGPRGGVEEREPLTGGDGPVVIPGDERRAPLAEQREVRRRIGSVADRVAHHPDP